MSRKVNVNKIKKFAKTLRVIINIMIVMMIIGLIGGIVIGGIMAFNPNSSFTHTSLQLNIGRHLNIQLSDNKFMEVDQVRGLIFAIASSMVPMMISIIVIIKIIRDLLITVECGKPFNEKNPKRLLIIGITVIVGSIFESFGYLLIYKLVMPMIDALRLENVNFTINLLDGSTLLLGVIIILISEIFKYGCYLQNEYDETV